MANNKTLVLPTGTLGNILDAFTKYFNTDWILNADGKTVISEIRSTYNVTQKYIEELKTSACNNEQLTTKPIIVTFDPDLNIEFDEIESLPMKNPYIVPGMTTAWTDPIIDINGLRITPSISAIKFKIDVKVVFESLYQYLDHLIYYQIKSRRGGNNIERDLNLGNIILNFTIPTDLHFITDDQERQLIYNELNSKYERGNLKFINNKEVFNIPFIVAANCKVSTLNAAANKAKDSLLTYHSINLGFEFSLNLPICLDIETVYYIENFIITVLDTHFQSAQVTSDINNIAITKGYTNIKEMNQVLSFDDDYEDFAIFTEIPEDESDKYYIIIRHNEKTINQESLLQDKYTLQEFHIPIVKKGDLIMVFIFKQ